MNMDFQYDVFLSHSFNDKTVVRTIAKRLKTDRLKVWFDEWEIMPGDSIPAKIEEGLEHSRVLVLCMSANAFGSDWAQLEAGTFRFRDPLNKDRRFIPLRLDDAPIKGSLEQFLYINWNPKDQKQEYPKLLEACWPPTKPKKLVRRKSAPKQTAEKVIQLDYDGSISAYAFSPDRKYVVLGGEHIDTSSSKYHSLQKWDLETGQCLSIFAGHKDRIWSVAWSADQRRILSVGDDGIALILDVETGQAHSLYVLQGRKKTPLYVIWRPDQRCALFCCDDGTIELWDIATEKCQRVFEGHAGIVWVVECSSNGLQALSGGEDGTIRLWDLETGHCLFLFNGHTDLVMTVTWSSDQRRALSGSHDGTVRLWDLEKGSCLGVFEGHTAGVNCVAWNPDQRYALSGAYDTTVRLWDTETGRCLSLLKGHDADVRNVVWSTDQRHAFSGDSLGGIRVWDLAKFITKERMLTFPTPDQVQYTNAKVLLVGESGAGKTGLSKRLALDDWQPSDSTVGAWATHWRLPISSTDGLEREIWLWDFGGQADQRLIHQLYMDETALAVLVFDGQKEDLFETLGQWDRDLTRASRKEFAKILVAGRVDAGGLRVSRTQIEAFRKERGYLQLMETSAKANIGCKELKEAILDGIRWEDIPWRSSPLLFKRLKEEIVRLKDENRVLMRLNELRDTLQIRLSGEIRFADAELKAVVGLLAGPGVVWELKFGSWVLLQPERINAYAQAVIQTMRQDEHERGCLPEEHVLKGSLTYHSSMTRLEMDEERFILLAMHQTLVERGLCLREHTDHGAVLIFPSYYRRERPELVGHPAVLVSYRFSGFLDDIYATLVVRLHHTKPFQQDQLWRYAADFKTLTDKQLGVKLTRRAEGAGELEVYFDPTISLEEKIIFSKYVHEHLLRNARDVERLRHYVCPHCGTPVGNREVAMRKLAEGKKDILCVDCERRLPLWDKLEELFASDQTKQQVRELEEQSAIVLDNESKERALVGEVISTVALAGQISREFNVSDHGIDMEIEFKDDFHEATGKKLYLQLKSGDSYLRERKRDGAEIFTIKNERHARYWMAQEFPVLLVIRNSEEEVRWMEVRDYLKRTSNNGAKPTKQIIFDGERFDVMSVRRWRERVLGQGLP